MEIKINSNAEINLSNILDVEFVEAKVSSYKLKEQSLSGDVLIYGKYKKKDPKKQNSEYTVEFEDIVPFTVVFNREHIKIDEVEIENFKYEMIEEGIKCSFVIEIEYNDEEKEEEIEEELDEFEEVEIVPSYELDEDSKNTYEVLKEMNDEIGEITNKLDEKLEEFFDERNEVEEFIEDSKKQELDNQSIIHKKEGLVKNFKNEGTCVISIYYTNNPSDIEKISKKENVGIDKLYKDNEDFSLTNRIVVKK